MKDEIIIALVAVIISGVTSFASLYLTIRTNRETNKLAKASRRTLALNCLSDEQLALLRVRTECESLHLLIISNLAKLGDNKDFLLSEVKRIVAESKIMLDTVEKKRSEIEGKINALIPAEIEEIIAEAYQGKIMAEAQWSRTARSREDTIKLYLKED